jgi:hypothetical protein
MEGKGIDELSKGIGSILINFEKNVNKETVDGKRAVLLIMAINDIEAVVKGELDKLRSEFQKQQEHGIL